MITLKYIVHFDSTCVCFSVIVPYICSVILVVCVCFRYFTNGSQCTKKLDKNDTQQRKYGKNILVAPSVAPAMVLAVTRQSWDPSEREKEQKRRSKRPWCPPQGTWLPPHIASQPQSPNSTCGTHHSAWRPSCTSCTENNNKKCSVFPHSTIFSSHDFHMLDLTLCTYNTINRQFHSIFWASRYPNYTRVLCKFISFQFLA